MTLFVILVRDNYKESMVSCPISKASIIGFSFSFLFFRSLFSKVISVALASEGVRSFTVLLSRSKDMVCLVTATELRFCIVSFETTGNLETCTFLR